MWPIQITSDSVLSLKNQPKLAYLWYEEVENLTMEKAKDKIDRIVCEELEKYYFSTVNTMNKKVGILSTYLFSEKNKETDFLSCVQKEDIYIRAVHERDKKIASVSDLFLGNSKIRG